MKHRDEQAILRRRQADLSDTPEHRHAPPTEGKRIYVGKVVRDDRFWPYTNRDIVLGGVVRVPGPPYVAMTRPLDFGPIGGGGTVDEPTVDTGDALVPVISVNEAPIDGTQVIARNVDGQWTTDDAFGGYFNITIVGDCSDVVTDGTAVTVDGLAAPPSHQSGTWSPDPSGSSYQVAAILFDPAPTGGTFVIKSTSTVFGSGPTWQTTPIAFDADAATVQAAMLAAGVTVTCLDGPLPGKAILVKQDGLLNFTVDPSGLTGGRNAVLQVGVGPYTRGGTYTLKSGATATDPIPFDASLDAFRDIVERFPAIGPGNVRVTDAVADLATGRYLLEFVNARGGQAFTPFTSSDTTNLTGPAPAVILRTVQAGSKPTPTLAGTSPGILDPNSRFSDPTAAIVLPYRTRGPYRITAHSPVGDWPDVVIDDTPPAGLRRLPVTVGQLPDKVCSCFGRVHPAFTVSTPFGTLDLTPQQYNPTTGVYSDYDPTVGFLPGNVFGDRWVFDGAVTATGYAACIDTLEAVTVIGDATSSGSTRLRVIFACGSPPGLTIQFLIGSAVIYGAAAWQFVNHSNWQTDYCPSTTTHCTFTSATIGCYPTVPDLPLSHYMDSSSDGTHSGGITYSGSLPVTLPVIATFSVGSAATAIGRSPGVFPISFSGLAGTWTVNES